MQCLTVLSIGVLTGWLALLAPSGVLSAAPATGRERKNVEQLAAALF